MAKNTPLEVQLEQAHRYGRLLWKCINQFQKDPNWPGIKAQFNENLGTILDKIDVGLDRDIDGLTGLPANPQLVRRLGVIVDEIRTGTVTDVAVLYIDINGFKRINDVFGHHAANEVLIEASLRIVRFVEEKGFVARIGGDEFVVVIPNVESEIRALVHGMQLKKLLDDRYLAGDKLITVKVSVGYDWADAKLEQISQPGRCNHMVLVDRADRSRILGKDEPDLRVPTVVRLTEEGWRRHQEQVLNETNLENVVQQGLFDIAVQPIVNLETGQIVAAEFLAGPKWSTSQSFDLDFGVLEESGAISGISSEVLRQAETSIRLWKKFSNDTSTRINLNVTPGQLTSGTIVENLLQMDTTGALPGHRVTLEVTERQELRDDRATRTNINALVSQGFSFACDDFSLSHGSATRIATFQAFSAIKIDMGMIKHILTNRRMKILVGGIVKSARDMEMQVTAEGVTDPAQVDMLKEIGCDFGQGFLFGKPVSPSEFVKLLAEQSNAAAARR